MDPVTAISNGIGQLFAFLATPQGQGVVSDIRAINKDFAVWINDLVGHLHGQTITTPPKT